MHSKRKENKTAKGIIKSVIIKELGHEIYNNILEMSHKLDLKTKVIRAQKHRIYMMELIKVSLSAYDNKR